MAEDLVNLDDGIFRGAEVAREQAAQDVVLTETNRKPGDVATTSSPEFSNTDAKLTSFNQIDLALELKPEIANEIDHAIVNNPVMATAFRQLLASADTNSALIADVEGMESAQVEQWLEIVLPSLFPLCGSMYELDMLIASHLLRYGVFATQVRFDANGGARAVIPPPEELRYVWSVAPGAAEADDKSWWLTQTTNDNKKPPHQPTFIHKTLFAPIQRIDGVFWPIPFKSGIRMARVYDIFAESFAQITAKSKMLTHLKVAVGTKVVDRYADDKFNASQKSGGARKEFDAKNEYRQEFMNNYINSSNPGIDNQLAVALVGNTPDESVNFEKIDDMRKPDFLKMLSDMVISHIVAGCMLPHSLSGVPTGENQTTVSTNHKRLYSQVITTLQTARDSVKARLAKLVLLAAGYTVNSLRFEPEPPALDGEKEMEEARKLRLENDLLALEVERILSAAESADSDTQEVAQDVEENNESQEDE